MTNQTDTIEEKIKALNAELYQQVENLLDCPQWVDEATMPKNQTIPEGVNGVTDHVVLNFSISLTRIRKIRALLEELKTKSQKEGLLK